VVRQVDRTHATAAEFALDPALPEHLPRLRLARHLGLAAF